MKEGDITRQQISLPDFDEIELHDRINLVLIQDSINEGVVIEAGENIIPHLELTVTDKKLVIKDKTKFRWTRDLNYEVTAFVTQRNFTRLSYYGAGNISSGNILNLPAFTLDSWTGTGSIRLNMDVVYSEFHIRMANADITVEGKGNFTRLYCADHGSVDLSNFSTNEMVMDYRSIRDSYINVKKLLTANMLYKGNVFYRGQPDIVPVFTSSGRLIPYQ